MDLKETYNRIAEDWVQDHNQDDWWVEGAEKFATCLAPGSTLLDLGCGGGLKSKFFAEKGFRVVGADFSPKMVEIARRENPGVDFRVADVHDLSTIPETFDGIFLQAVLLHVPKAEVPGVMRELARKLSTGGHVYLTVKEVRPDRNEEGVLTENDYGYEYERFFSYFTLPELKTFLADAGMRPVFENISPIGKTRWIHVIAQKI